MPTEITATTEFRVYEFEGAWYYAPIGYDLPQAYSEPCDSEEDAREMVAAELAMVEEATL